MVSKQTSILELSGSIAPDIRRTAHWVIGLVAFCLLPLLAMVLGVDFSSGTPPLDPDAVVTQSASQLKESGFDALRGSFTHTILEWTAVCAAFFVALLAFVQYRLTREASLPIIGIALACAGAMDAFHTFAADRLIDAVAANEYLIPFTWAICRLFNAMIMLTGVGLFAFSTRSRFAKGGNVFIFATCALFMGTAYLIIHACAVSESLPQTMFADAVIKRPYDIYPIVPYLLCGLLVFPMYYKRYRTLLAASLMLSIIPQVATQLYMAFGSFKLHDASFNIAHALKSVAYFVPIAGLMMEFSRAYRAQKQMTLALKENERSLKRRAEEAILLSTITDVAAQATCFEGALRECIEKVCDTTGWPVGHAYITADDGTKTLKTSDTWFLLDPKAFERFRAVTEQTKIAPEAGLPGRVMQSAKPAWIVDVRNDENFSRAKDCPSIEVRGAFAFPVQSHGEVVAVLEFFDTLPAEPYNELLQTMSILGGQLGRVIDRVRAAEDARRREENLNKVLHDLGMQRSALNEHAIVSIADIKGNITYINDKFCSISGYTQEELLGHNHRTVRSGEHSPEFYRHLWLTISRGKVWKGEIKNKRKDGSFYWVAATIVPFKDTEGKIEQYVAIRTDITSVKEAEEHIRAAADKLEQSNLEMAAQQEEMEALNTELRATNSALDTAQYEAEQASKAKSDFLANMSHEIRTPMTAILGFTESLREEGNLQRAPQHRIDAIDTIHRNGEHLLSVINDILDMSKIEAGKMTVEHIPCSPQQIVHDVITLMKSRTDAKNVSLNSEYMGEIPETILSDPTRLKQILLNIVGNALKFTEEGGIRMIVRFIPDNTTPALQFDIIDTGIGMTEEQAGNLFKAFAQADSTMTRKFGGTGLGLSISKTFAEMLGGEISIVDTQPGVGTRFRIAIATGSLEGVRLIDHNAFATRKTSGKQPPPPRTTNDAALNCHILLAEDGPDNQRLISFMLKKVGANVTVVENGQLAVEAALAARDEGKPFDIILMDMQMPVLDGYGATRMLRDNDYEGPIVALTAHAMHSDREKCINSGCDDYVTKPIDRKHLIATINSHLPKPNEDHHEDHEINTALVGN